MTRPATCATCARRRTCPVRDDGAAWGCDEWEPHGGRREDGRRRRKAGRMGKGEAEEGRGE